MNTWPPIPRAVTTEPGQCGLVTPATLLKRQAFLRGSATARILCVATCCGLGLLTAKAAASQTFEDLSVTLRPDGECYVLTISNVLAQSLFHSEYVIPGEIAVGLIVERGSGDIPEEITITTPDEYFADPSELTLPDNASAQVVICSRVGA